MWWVELSSECGASCLLNGPSCLLNVGRVVLGRFSLGRVVLGRVVFGAHTCDTFEITNREILFFK